MKSAWRLTKFMESTNTLLAIFRSLFIYASPRAFALSMDCDNAGYQYLVARLNDTDYNYIEVAGQSYLSRTDSFLQIYLPKVFVSLRVGLIPPCLRPALNNVKEIFDMHECKRLMHSD